MLAIGVLGLALLGLGARALLDDGPETGRRVNRALALAGRGDRNAAFLELQSLLEDRPEDPEAWYRAGRALRDLGRPNESSVYLTKAIDLDPTSSLLRYELAKSLLSAGLQDESRVAVGDLLTLDPDHANGLYLGAALSAARGDLETTLVLFDRAMEESASDPDRFRWDPLFDPVRNDARFLDLAHLWRVPGAFREDEDDRS